MNKGKLTSIEFSPNEATSYLRGNSGAYQIKQQRALEKSDLDVVLEGFRKFKDSQVFHNTNTESQSNINMSHLPKLIPDENCRGNLK